VGGKGGWEKELKGIVLDPIPSEGTVRKKNVRSEGSLGGKKEEKEGKGEMGLRDLYLYSQGGKTKIRNIRRDVSKPCHN